MEEYKINTRNEGIQLFLQITISSILEKNTVKTFREKQMWPAYDITTQFYDFWQEKKNGGKGEYSEDNFVPLIVI